MSENATNRLVIFGKPKDRSPAAFREFVMGIARKFDPGARDTMSEADWAKDAARFWEGADKTKVSGGAS